MAETGIVSSLEKLKNLSKVVADTGDFLQIRQFKPEDATTNPSLLFQAAQLPAYAHLVEDAVSFGKKQGLQGDELVDAICDKMAINFGVEILKIVPGVVSTEVDASLSFDTAGSKKKALKLIEMYKDVGIPKERILIKLASTWEGCQAAAELEKLGIHCNMTLLFSMAQAIAAAEAGATLISPFVGRILDWHKKNNLNLNIENTKTQDPGVVSVTEIYNYYKKCGYKTVVMGASFRNSCEIVALAGCDKLTVSPKFLTELANSADDVPLQLSAGSDAGKLQQTPIDQAKFRWMMNEDAMATEKLSEGIRNFNKDMLKLKDLIRSKVNNQ